MPTWQNRHKTKQRGKKENTEKNETKIAMKKPTLNKENLL